MSFRTTLVRCAKEVQHRSPAIKFPDRKHADHSSHSVQPHPCAPQSVIDNFPRFQSTQSASFSGSQAGQNSSSYGGPVDPSSQGQGQGSSSGSGSKGGRSAAIEEWEMPDYLKRRRYAPTELEIEAIQSGGATESTPVTRETKLTWYTEQI
ncbi:uncharacterized protein JCM6883_007328 [Sporobolomyces salmoneus]|uniref:uncharacterized protein n=1 Tax=Sporobolomyces salmoneus TaxID=183962 RepID=UPI003179EA9F